MSTAVSIRRGFAAATAVAVSITAAHADISIDEFEDGPFNVSDTGGGSGLELNIPCSAIGGVRGVRVSDSGGNTIPTVASLVEGDGYMQIAVGNSPGTYSVGYGSFFGGTPLNLDLTTGNEDRLRVLVSDGPPSGGVLFVTLTSNSESVEESEFASLPLSGPGLYEFLFSAGFGGVDFSDIDGIEVGFSGPTQPAFSNHRIEWFRITGPPTFGGCCINGICFDSMTEASCVALGGVYLGDNVFCVASSCFNDDCDDAITILAGDTAYSNVGATTDGPALPAECNEGSGLSFGKDVWYRYVPTANGTLTVSTCNQVDYDSRLAAYTGDCGVLSLIACNDDSPGCSNFSSLMTLQVTCGQEILLRVGAFGGAEGSGTLSLTLEACLPDLNGDGVVDIQDLLILLAGWGVCPASP